MTTWSPARWRLSRTNYEYYSGELSKLTGIKAPPPVWEETVYSIAQFARNGHIASGERVLQAASSTPVLVIWRTRGETQPPQAFTPEDIGTWLARVPGFAFGLETLGQPDDLPAPKERPHADRVLSFANAHWRLTAERGPTGERSTEETDTAAHGLVARDRSGFDGLVCGGQSRVARAGGGAAPSRFCVRRLARVPQPPDNVAKHVRNAGARTSSQ